MKIEIWIIVGAICLSSTQVLGQQQHLYFSLGNHFPSFSDYFNPHNQTYGNTSDLYTSLGKGYSLKAGWQRSFHPAFSFQTELAYFHGIKREGSTSYEAGTFYTLDHTSEVYGRLISVSPQIVVHLLKPVQWGIGPVAGFGRAKYVDYYPSSTKVSDISKTPFTPTLGWRSNLTITFLKTARTALYANVEVTSISIRPKKLQVQVSPHSVMGDFEVTYDEGGAKEKYSDGVLYVVLPAHTLPFGSIAIQLGTRFTL